MRGLTYELTRIEDWLRKGESIVFYKQGNIEEPPVFYLSNSLPISFANTS